MYTLHEICNRNVINMEKGVIIGTVDDIVFDAATARIEALMIYGRARLFGLLGRDSDVRVAWNEILSIGQDVIMVSTPVPQERQKKGKLRLWE